MNSRFQAAAARTKSPSVYLSPRILTLATAAVMAAILPRIASAGLVIPDPIFAAQLSTLHTSQGYSSPGSYTLAGITTTIVGSPALAGHAVALDVAGSFESSISYSYAVDGPLKSVLVPLFIAPALYVSAIASGDSRSSAIARFVLTAAGNTGVQLYNIFVEASNANQPTASFSATLPFNAISGQVGGVHLQIDATVWGAAGVADAFADPFISVDPAFLLSHPGYVVIVSPGIGNTAVPEPTTFAQLGVGLLAVAFARRLRKH